ncbi:MAG TPA: hypothetical protein VFR37_06455 [Longimicrobium sp.]|nr:hypothetical protein [Longimicrobium sp.]
MIRFAPDGALRVALLATATLAADAGAQGITLAGGARLYDGGDGESATMVAVRTEFPIGTSALLEFASSLSDVPEPARSGVRSVFEAQVQLPIRLGDVLTPYFGVGGGIGNVNRVSPGDDSGWKGVLSFSTGVRVALARQLGVVLDARYRGIGAELTGSHVDVTAGLRYSLQHPDRARSRAARP